MPGPTRSRSRRTVPIVLAQAALTFAPVSRAASLALPDLSIAVFFLGGITYASLGGSAPWLVLIVVLASVAARAVDIESWSLLLSGGMMARVRAAFGPRAASAAAAAVLFERILLTALSCVVVGQYVGWFLFAGFGQTDLQRRVTQEDVTALVAVLLLGVVWIRARIGQRADPDWVVRSVWLSVAALVALVVFGAAAVLAMPDWRTAFWQVVGPPAVFRALPAWSEGLPLALVTACAVGIGLALPGLGGGESLTRVAGELQPPRVRGLRRAGWVVVLFGLLVTVPVSFLFPLLVPATSSALWVGTPLIGIAQHVTGSFWTAQLLSASITVSAVVMLGHAARAGLAEAEATLSKLAQQGVVPQRLRLPHPRFGTFTDTAAAAVLLAILASGGRVSWLAAAYGIGVAWMLTFKVAALARLRTRSPGPTFRIPGTLRMAGREWPLGLWLIGAFALLAALALVASGHLAALAGTLVLAGLATALALPTPTSDRSEQAAPEENFELLAADDAALEQPEARPGGLLVTVRNPHALAHLAAAINTAGDRDIVVMTVRLLGADGLDEEVGDSRPTSYERELFSAVLALAERQRRPVRLLIVPANNVFDAVVAAVLRLQTSEVHVGESATLSADAQSKLLGDAWERASKPHALAVRLVIHHRSGRTDTFHLGAHAPSLSSSDLDLLHSIWLEAVEAGGSHIHHADVVRAALNHMAEQLNGPERDEVLRAIRRAAKPADELAAAVRARDFSRLHAMVRNRPATDLAALLSELGIEEQVVVFRLLPRKDAAATFEYLSREAQEALLKAMAQEDVAAILNNMSPDDRTMFLEELPATVTRQLLTLLTPEERSVALTLLGYPEDSVGRLMTPHYVAVREDWTVQEVLDYVRTHGQDSETLNVIYVIDEHGVLIDDVRIRELLLASPASRMADLMDRRFVALKAADDQHTAIAAFRQHDRTALPVTDSSGVLIGIVTVDDVLDVAEMKATEEIQKIGGSEALGEPYMDTAFSRMIQKRAGWLTVLFLGETLTATAMGVYEAEIERAVVLALFVPLIISSGGNCGSQAATLVIRALALGEVGLGDWWRVVRREIAAGLSLGGILGVIGFARIALWSIFSDVYGPHWLPVGITVGVTLVGIVLWGTMVGSLLPFVLRRLRFDPATSSAPFVATLVDVTGLVIYFSVATVFLRGTLL